MYLHIKLLLHSNRNCMHSHKKYKQHKIHAVHEVQYIASKPTHLLSECQCSVEETWKNQLS